MKPAKTRGRPRSLDRTTVLEKAMECFWRHGYEGSSIGELTQAMGCTAPSIYALFGSKEQLYHEALQHFLHHCNPGQAEAVLQAPSSYAAVESYLRTAALTYADPSHPAGCMLSTASLNCSPDNASITQWVTQVRARQLRVLAEHLRAGQQAGELNPDVDPESLARFYTAILQGMSVQAIDGATSAELNQLVDLALAAWPGKRGCSTRP